MPIHKPPSSPRGPIAVKNLSPSSIEIKWNSPEYSGLVPLSQYFVEMRESSSGAWNRIALVDPERTSYTIANIPREMNQFYVRIIARNREGESAPLLSSKIVVPKVKSPPSKPVHLTVAQPSIDSCKLDWQPCLGGSPVETYTILRKEMPFGDWIEVGSVRSPTTTYTISNLREGKAYYFAVYAGNSVGRSEQVENSRPIKTGRGRETSRPFVQMPVAATKPGGLLSRVTSFVKDKLDLSRTQSKKQDTIPLLERGEARRLTRQTTDYETVSTPYRSPSRITDEYAEGVIQYRSPSRLTGDYESTTKSYSSPTRSSRDYEVTTRRYPSPKSVHDYRTVSAPHRILPRLDDDYEVPTRSYRSPTRLSSEYRSPTRLTEDFELSARPYRSPTRLTDDYELSARPYRSPTRFTEDYELSSRPYHSPTRLTKDYELPARPYRSPTRLTEEYELPSRPYRSPTRLTDEYELSARPYRSPTRITRDYELSSRPYRSPTRLTEDLELATRLYRSPTRLTNDYKLSSRPYRSPTRLTDEYDWSARPYHSPTRLPEADIYELPTRPYRSPSRLSDDYRMSTKSYRSSSISTEDYEPISKTRSLRDLYRVTDEQDRTSRQRRDLSRLTGDLDVTFSRADYAVPRKSTDFEGGKDYVAKKSFTDLKRFFSLPRKLYNVPSAPGGPLEISDIARDCVLLSWRAPRTDGGASISGYIIECRELRRSTWNCVAHVKPEQNSFLVNNLTEGREYVFRIFAENVEGRSEPLTLDGSVIVRRQLTKPSPPSGQMRIKTTKDDSVMLEWNAPADTGGSVLLHYIVEYRRKNAYTWKRAAVLNVSVHSCTISGITDSSDYEFRVMAVNKMGASEPLVHSAASTISKPTQQYFSSSPNASGGPLVISHIQKHSVTLTWRPSDQYLSDGTLRSPPIGYIIEKCDLQSALSGWTRVDHVGPYLHTYTVSHLIEGHRYLFRVIEENAFGCSEPLQSYAPVTAMSSISIPEPPMSVRLVGIDDDSLTIEWTRPVSDGRSPITGYLIEKRESKSHLWTEVGTTRAHTTIFKVRHLYPNVLYHIRVAAVNDEGVGEFRELSEAIQLKKTSGCPSAPRNVAIESLTPHSVTLKWSTPESSGNLPLSGYIVEQYDQESAKWHVVGFIRQSQTWWTLQNVVVGNAYRFKIRAQNANGPGPSQELSSPIIPRPSISTPSSPKTLEVVSATSDSVTLSWLPPTNDGGSRILKYTLEMCEIFPSHREGWIKLREIDSGDILLATVEGLTEGKSYRFRVYAENQAGPGPAIELRESVVPTGILESPSSPEGPLRVTRVTRSMLTLQWRPPQSTGGSAILRYIVEKRFVESSHWLQAGMSSPDVTTFCATNLAEDQGYRFRVLAENAHGVSEPLELASAVIPKRVFEYAPLSQANYWSYDSATTALSDRGSSSHATRRLQHLTYTSYDDEPLTMALDNLDSTW